MKQPLALMTFLGVCLAGLMAPPNAAAHVGDYVIGPQDVLLVTVSAPGAGSLADTGAATGPLVVAGGLLMLTGGAATVLSRRRRPVDA